MRQPPLRFFCTLALLLGAWLILPGEGSTGVASPATTTVIEAGGQGARRNYDDGMTQLEQQSVQLLTRIDALDIKPVYCPPSARTEAFAELQNLESQYTALQQAFDEFRAGVTNVAKTPVGRDLWIGQTNPTNLHFWDGPSKDILGGPRAALDLKLKEWKASKAGCPDTTEKPPPPPGRSDDRGSGAGGAGAGGAGAGGAGAGSGAGGRGTGSVTGGSGPGGTGTGGTAKDSGGGAALPKGLHQPSVPNFELPKRPDHFCSEADRDKWLKDWNTLWNAIQAAETSVRDYSGDVYFAMYPAGAGAGPQGSEATLAALKKEADWAAAEEASLDALQQKLVKIRSPEPPVIDCNDPKGTNSFNIQPDYKLDRKLRFDYRYGATTGSDTTGGAGAGTGASGTSGTGTGGTDTSGTGTSGTGSTGVGNSGGAGTWGMPPQAMNLDTGPADAVVQVIIVIITETTVPGVSPMRPLGPLTSWLNLIEPRVFAAERQQASSGSPLQAVFVSLGTATGDTFDAHFINDDENDASIEADAVVLEAVGRDRQDRARKEWENAVKARGPNAPAPTVARLSGYCGEYTKLPPAQGTIYRLADTKTQMAQAELRRVLRTEEALERQQAFTPTMDPKTFYNILRQWSIWTVAQKFSADDFAREFPAHAKTNILAARQPWNATVEAQIRASVPQWWAAVSRVLTEAAKAR